MNNITYPAVVGATKDSQWSAAEGRSINSYARHEYKPITIIRSDEVEAAEAEFIRTHVGRYVLPKALATAQGKKAKTVSAPIGDVTRLMARVGEHIAPVETDNAPAFPEALTALPAELSGMFDWEPDGEAIVSRDQVEALIAQVARIAYATPKITVRRKPTATLAETVAAALTAGKVSVSIPATDLERMLETVAAQREIQHAAREAVAA